MKRKKVSERLKQWRERESLTVQEISEFCGISKREYLSIERGVSECSNSIADSLLEIGAPPKMIMALQQNGECKHKRVVTSSQYCSKPDIKNGVLKGSFIEVPICIECGVRVYDQDTTK